LVLAIPIPWWKPPELCVRLISTLVSSEVFLPDGFFWRFHKPLFTNVAPDFSFFSDDGELGRHAAIFYSNSQGVARADSYTFP
jgi:hypothetical protein